MTDPRPAPNPVPGDPQSKLPEPWWNDKNKVGGAASTIILLGAVVGMIALFYLGIILLAKSVL